MAHINVIWIPYRPILQKEFQVIFILIPIPSQVVYAYQGLIHLEQLYQNFSFYKWNDKYEIIITAFNLLLLVTLFLLTIFFFL